MNSNNSIKSTSVPEWYAFYVTTRHEKRIYSRISELDVEVYLPIVKKWNQWSDRKKEIESPLIPGYIFCHIRVEDRIPILQTPGVLNIVKIGGKWAPIPNEQIETLKLFVKNSETLSIESKIVVGEEVKVVRGVFTGAIGIVKHESGNMRLVLSFEKLGLAYSVVIKKSDLQRVSQ